MKNTFKTILALFAVFSSAANLPVVQESEYDIYVQVYAGIIPGYTGGRDWRNDTQFYLTDSSGAEHVATAAELNARYRFILVETGAMVEDETTGEYGSAFSEESGYERIRFITTTDAVREPIPMPSGVTEDRVDVWMRFYLPIEFFGDDQENYDFQSIWDETCVSIVVEDTVSKCLYTLSVTPGGSDRVCETPLYGSITLDPEQHAYMEGNADNEVFNAAKTDSKKVYLGARLPFSSYWRLKAGLPTENDVRAWRTANNISQDAFDAALALGMTSTNDIVAFASTFNRFDVSVTSVAGNNATLSYSVLTTGQPRTLTDFPSGSLLTRYFATNPAGPWTEADSAVPSTSASILPPAGSGDPDAGFFKFKLTIPPFFE